MCQWKPLPKFKMHVVFNPVIQLLGFFLCAVMLPRVQKYMHTLKHCFYEQKIEKNVKTSQYSTGYMNYIFTHNYI